jgi:type II secretory ATPase GspE/PulE/Tfp pilus assembly ATPase PilB-like protein
MMVQGSDGVVLAVGPTGSGKTTTLYSLLGELNEPDTKIITLEDPVENQIESISQVNCDAKIDMTFSRGLRAAMRQDPDVILVGEIRDYETAAISVQAALTGHIVLSTLHTIGAAETISRMKEMGVEHYLLADTLRGIVAQRLVRLICPICKMEDKVEASLSKQLGLGPDEVFYKGAGCEDCNNTGYKGRRGVYEIMTIDAEFRDALRENQSVDALRAIAVANGMTTIRQEGIYYARAGQTTLAEVISKTPATNS